MRLTYSHRYDRLVRIADAFIKEYDPCKWDQKNKRCAAGKDGCCQECKSLNTKTGCKVVALTCKMWFCSYVKDRLPNRALYILQRLAHYRDKHDFYAFRGDKARSIRGREFIVRKKIELS